MRLNMSIDADPTTAAGGSAAGCCGPVIFTLSLKNGPH